MIHPAHLDAPTQPLYEGVPTRRLDTSPHPLAPSQLSALRQAHAQALAHTSLVAIQQQTLLHLRVRLEQIPLKPTSTAPFAPPTPGYRAGVACAVAEIDQVLEELAAEKALAELTRDTAYAHLASALGLPPHTASTTLHGADTSGSQISPTAPAA